MIGRITVKRALKHAAGRAAAATVPFVRRPRVSTVCILMYHRVADIDFVDPDVDDWNVRPDTFARQLAALSECAEFVRLADVPERLLSSVVSDRPLVCVTFDDGYANVLTRALPVLLRHGAPATVFVVTGYVGSTEPMPFDAWGQKHRHESSPETWRAATWDELRAAVQTGLVSVESHSDRHLDGRLCDARQFEEEARRSRAVLRERLDGDSGSAYAYPYGSTRLGHVPPAYITGVRQAGYALAVSTDLGLADGTSDPYGLPRVEVHELDSPAVLRAKVRGALAPLKLTDRLRVAHRSRV
jgi:peptidoglycan/xylan/chitin deacetylase (PgdA/CDA1 family)